MNKAYREMNATSFISHIHLFKLLSKTVSAAAHNVSTRSKNLRIGVVNIVVH